MPGLISRFKPKLLTRIALALALVGLLPLTLVAMRLTNINRSAMLDNLLATHSVAARTTATRIESTLAADLALAESVAGNPILSQPRSAEARAVLSETLKAWSGQGVVAIAIVDPEGNEVIRAQVAEWRAEWEIEEALAAAPAGPVELPPSNDMKWIRLQAALPEARGFVWLIAVGSQLQEALDSWELGESADLALVGPGGGLLAGSVATLTSFPATMVTDALGSVTQATRLFEEAGIVGSYAPVAGADWVVLSKQPIGVADAVGQRMRRQSTLALAGAGLLILLMSALAYASIVRPIRGLADAQRALVKARPEAEVGDEVDMLRAAFEALEKGMEDRAALDSVFLGRYQVLEAISTGGMGSVFKGWDPKLQRPVALKTLAVKPQSGYETLADEGPQSQASLLQEATTVAGFSHPNIVSVFDVEDAPGSAFIAMEFIDGPTVQQVVWETGPLYSGEAARVGAGVARALQAAHERDLVHRDIKPGNILLGKNGSVKVTDFGIASFITSIGKRPDSIFGTPGYVSPEALEGRGDGPSGDLFALGVTLYFCVTGRLPYRGRGIKEINREILAGEPEELADVAPDVESEFARLVMSLIATEPQDRPSSAERAAEVLESVAQREACAWPLSGVEIDTGVQAKDQAAAARWLKTSEVPAMTRRVAGG